MPLNDSQLKSLIAGIGEAGALELPKLLPAFTQTEKAWDDMGQSAAAEWARTARDHAVAIDKAANADGQRRTLEPPTTPPRPSKITSARRR